MKKDDCFLVWKKPDIENSVTAGDIIRIIIIKEFYEDFINYDELYVDSFSKIYSNRLDRKTFDKTFEIIKQIPNVLKLRENLINNYKNWFKKHPDSKFDTKMMSGLQKKYERLKKQLEKEMEYGSK